MLNTQIVIDFLTKKGQSSFEDIWQEVKKQMIDTLSKEMDENVVKTDLHFSIMEDKRIIMVGQNQWDLASSFSFDETQEINKKVFGDELEKTTSLENDEE